MIEKFSQVQLLTKWKFYNHNEYFHFRWKLIKMQTLLTRVKICLILEIWQSTLDSSVLIIMFLSYFNIGGFELLLAI